VTARPERWLSQGTMVLVPALAAFAWAVHPALFDALLLVGTIWCLPILAGRLAPLVQPRITAPEAARAGLYAMLAAILCGALAVWLEEWLYGFGVPLTTMLAACLVALIVYAGATRWAFAGDGRFRWAWPAAVGLGVLSWLAVLALAVLF
jgi:hypothetical protein